MITLPVQAKTIINTLHKAGFKAYAVGGSIRDALMGRETRGWDFTTNAKPEEILTLFPDSFYDNQFGTVGVKIVETIRQKDDKTKRYKGVLQRSGSYSEADLTVSQSQTIDVFEITTYRSEKGYSDHRHPDTIVWGKTIEEDLARRDYTINAIAFDGKTIIDPHKGLADIEKKLIRAVGDPAVRIAEDALRMMRAVRIAAELGFFIEEQTLSAIRQNAKLLSQISRERIHDELMRLLSSKYPADGVLLLKNSGLLHEILPELEACFAVKQKSPMRHHIYDVGTHSVMAMKLCPSTDPIVRLATLLHDIGKVQTYRKDETGLITFYNHEVVSTKLARRIADRLRLSKKNTEKLLTLIRWHQFSVDERQTDSALRRFIRRVGKENLDDMLALRIGDRLGGGAQETSWRLELYKKRLIEVQKQPFTVADLKINGFDVMKACNCKPGPVVGKVLNQLFAEVEKGMLTNDRKKLLARLKEMQSGMS